MFELHEGKKRTLTLNVAKSDGNPGVVDGIPEWTVEPADLASLTVAEDGMSAVMDWVAAGDVTVMVTADGDLSNDVFTIVAQETFTMMPSLGAVSATISVSDEEPV